MGSISNLTPILSNSGDANFRLEINVSYISEKFKFSLDGPGVQLTTFTSNFSAYSKVFSILSLNKSVLSGIIAKFILPVSSSITGTLIKTIFKLKSSKIFFI